MAKIVSRSLVQAEAKQVSIPTHRIMVVDCSGSMYGELPKLRKQLKNKLTTLVAPDDSLSIIWFSSKGQCGVLFEDVQISTAADLSKVHAAIDRFLVPTGLTGFVDPLNKVVEMVVANSSKPASMAFMTDGGENQSSRKEVLKACAAVSEVVSSITFVEYGYYADHNLLVAMAEESGGSVVQSENYDDYVEQLDRILKGKSAGKRKVVEDIMSDFDYIVGITDSSVVIAKVVGGKATLPASTTEVVYFTTAGATAGDVSERSKAGLVSALINKGDIQSALDIAGEIGDVDLFKSIENAFSKQDYARAAQLASEYATGEKKLFSTAPKTANLQPDPNAYNVLTLLMDLSSVEGNLLHIGHPEFKYTSIGAKRETVPDENGFVPQFTDTATDVKAPISTLKFDEDRPNISMLVRREGTVSLPKNDLGLGESVPSFIWRNYTIVRDGIVYVKKLPVVLTKATYDLLVQNGVPLAPFKINQTYVIDLTKMPVINRKMAAPTTAKAMFTKAFELYKLTCEQKVLGSKYEKPEVSAKFEELYGEEGALFLKKYGVTVGGFGPKGIAVDSIDPYVAKVLEIKMSGLNTVPKISDVEANIAKGKALTPSQQCVKMALDKHAGVADAAATHKQVIQATRDARYELVMMKFGIILGKKWFTDFASLEENTMEMDFGLGKQITCQAILGDKEV